MFQDGGEYDEGRRERGRRCREHNSVHRGGQRVLVSSHLCDQNALFTWTCLLARASEAEGS